MRYADDDMDLNDFIKLNINEKQLKPLEDDKNIIDSCSYLSNNSLVKEQFHYLFESENEDNYISNVNLQEEKTTIIKDLLMKKHGCLLSIDYKSYFAGKVEDLICSKETSIIMQENIDLLKPYYDEIFNELKENFIFLFRQIYANYFCQLLFCGLSSNKRTYIIKALFSCLNDVIKNIISFKALICLLELPMSIESQIMIKDVFQSIPSEITLSRSRYLKLLESAISGLNEENVDFVIRFVELKFIELVKVKQGFFLLRRLIKRISRVENINKIIKLISFSVHSLQNENGILLMQCLVKSIYKYNAEQSKNIIIKSFSKKVINLFYKLNACEASKIMLSSSIQENDLLIFYHKFIEFLMNREDNFSKQLKKLINTFLKSNNFFLILVNWLVSEKDIDKAGNLLNKYIDHSAFVSLIKEYFLKNCNMVNKISMKNILEYILANIPIEEDKFKEISSLLKNLKLENNNNNKMSKTSSSSTISTGFNSFNYNNYANPIYNSKCYPFHNPVNDDPYMTNQFCYSYPMFNYFYYPHLNTSYYYEGYSDPNIHNQMFNVNSEYMIRAITRHGTIKGTFLGVKRILTCW